MKQKIIKNVPASVFQRLLDYARKRGFLFNEVLQYYAMERFLYRLSESSHAKKFVLKGAMMMAVWKAPLARPTLDIDVLGKMSNDISVVVKVFQDISSLTVALKFFVGAALTE